MATLAFDTLDASKTLRNAGVDERMAEAIVQIVQRTTEMPDISPIQAELVGMREEMATKNDIGRLATMESVKEEIAAVRLEIVELRGEVRQITPELRAELSERLRGHTFATLGYMTAVIGLAVAVMKFVH